MNRYSLNYQLKGQAIQAKHELTNLLGSVKDEELAEKLRKIRNRLALALKPSPALLDLKTLRDQALAEARGNDGEFRKLRAKIANDRGYVTWADLEAAAFNGEYKGEPK